MISTRMAGALLCLALQGCATTSSPTAARTPEAPSLFGLRPGARLEDVTATIEGGGAHAATEGKRRTLPFSQRVAGVERLFTLGFERERLYSIETTTAPDPADEGAFASLQDVFARHLGIPEVMRCTSLQTGGLVSLTAKWPLRKGWVGWMSLVPGEAGNHGELHAIFSAPEFAPQAPEEPGLVKGRLDLPATGCPERRATLRRAATPSPTATPSWASATCGATPSEGLLGLEFGRSRSQIEVVTGPLRIVDSSRASFEREVEGVVSRVDLTFYSGCLAVIRVSPPSSAATARHHERLLRWSERLFGPGKGNTCAVTSDSAPPRQQISTRFESSTRAAALILEPAADCPEEDTIYLEVSSVPLRKVAPRHHFDFHARAF